MDDVVKLAKGRTLLRHVGQSGQSPTWSGRFKASDSYGITFDCSGVVGKASIRTDLLSMEHECSKGPNKLRIGRYPAGEKEFRRVTVSVPKGSGWAIVVSEQGA
ncbi:hypothetical protein [Nonomuraea rhizosphaerae]|uniref:hypothetical protein n=1 Tax=Nonomuraea rhizosphaerae TaxID=2665663 RepID=UPI001C5EDBC3|nr:hypothetical protein [Nonomuraea rhizosphaerae]